MLYNRKANSYPALYMCSKSYLALFIYKYPSSVTRTGLAVVHAKLVAKATFSEDSDIDISECLCIDYETLSGIPGLMWKLQMIRSGHQLLTELEKD